MLGIFDSGIGGLTVVRAIEDAIPDVSYVYFGDTARLPYGTKTPETIRRYTEDALAFLQERGATIPVIACHTASSVVVSDPKLKETITQLFGTEPYNVISAALGAVSDRTKNGRVGILATTATVESGVYTRQLSDFDVTQVPASVLVGLAEEGWVDKQYVDPILHILLKQFLDKGVDTVVLACTHFPILTDLIRDILGSDVALVDPGLELALQLRDADVESAENGRSFFATDISDDFAKRLSRFLGREVDVLPA